MSQSSIRGSFVFPVAVAVVGAMIISAASGIISYFQVFTRTPDFEVTLETTTGSTMQHEKVIIRNIGLAQAKNANIAVESNDTLTSVGERCFEGNFTAISPANVFEVEFDRISTNIRCEISFESSIDRGIQNLVITADDMIGFEFYPPSQGLTTQANAASMPNAVNTTYLPRKLHSLPEIGNWG